MSAGKEFQTDGAATEKARRASSVRVRGTASSGASDERRVRIGTRVCIRSLRYAGVAVARALWVSRMSFILLLLLLLLLLLCLA